MNYFYISKKNIFIYLLIISIFISYLFFEIKNIIHENDPSLIIIIYFLGLFFLIYLLHCLLNNLFAKYPNIFIDDQGILITNFMQNKKFIYWNEIQSFNIYDKVDHDGGKITTLTITLKNPKPEINIFTIFLDQMLNRESYYKEIKLYDLFFKKKDLYLMHKIIMEKFEILYKK